jgi:hypothetical protein
VSYREVPVHQVRETIRLWLAGEGIRSMARLAQLDRKTVRRYVEAAEVVGVSRDGGAAQLTDELVGLICEMVRPARTDGRGRAWIVLEENLELICAWVKAEVPLTKVQVLLARRGVVVPYRTLHRFAVERCEFGSRQATVRVADGEPGVECQIDFGRMGLVPDPAAGTATGVLGVDLYRLLQPLLLCLAELRPALERRDRRLRGGLGVLRRHVQGPNRRKCSADHFRRYVHGAVMWPWRPGPGGDRDGMLIRGT